MFDLLNKHFKLILGRRPTMEHRYSNRASSNMNVLIHKASTPVAFGRIVSSSKIGFFIETEFFDVNLDQALDIELITDGEGQDSYKCICNVRVIRKTKIGLGVEIESTSVESSEHFSDSPRSRDNRWKFPVAAESADVNHKITSI